MTSTDINADTSISTETTEANIEKLQAAYDVLKDKELIQEMVKTFKIDVKKFDEFKASIDDVYKDLKEKEDAKDLLVQLNALAEQKGLTLNPDALKQLFQAQGTAPSEDTTKKKRAKTELKWIKFEYDGGWYAIKRSTSGMTKGELLEYLESTGKTLADCVMDSKEFEDIENSKPGNLTVIDANNLGNLKNLKKKIQ